MLPAPNGPSQHMEALRDLRAVATALAERSNRGESSDEVIHWADGYPLSVRLYEALLFNIFDMFDPSQLIEVRPAGTMYEYADKVVIPNKM